MPELPEVETTCRGLIQAAEHQRILKTIVRQNKLREPVPQNLVSLLQGKEILKIQRRGKYILWQFDHGTLIIHLGMSGVFKIIDGAKPAEKHDHVDFILNNHTCLRYHDPRRFGLMVWTEQSPDEHPKIQKLGPEPLSDQWHAESLLKNSQKRSIAIKTLLMDPQVVVGVGNIYANEALFASNIHPQTRASEISLNDCACLVQHIKNILRQAIEQGGTTLKDFRQTNGKLGYFIQSLKVYGRENQPCLTCQHPIKKISLGQRGTYYCPHCQTINCKTRTS